MNPQDENAEDLSMLEMGADTVDTLQEDVVDRQSDYESLSSSDKKIVTRNQIRRVVRRHGKDGLTVQEVAEVTDLSESTVRKHLETLCKLREVYKQKKNQKLHLYYPNGKPLHSVGSKRIEDPNTDTILEVKVAQGRDDKLLFHILEKRYSLLDGEKTEGGIIFPIDQLDDLTDKLRELEQEVE